MDAGGAMAVRAGELTGPRGWQGVSSDAKCHGGEREREEGGAALEGDREGGGGVEQMGMEIGLRAVRGETRESGGRGKETLGLQWGAAWP